MGCRPRTQPGGKVKVRREEGDRQVLGQRFVKTHRLHRKSRSWKASGERGRNLSINCSHVGQIDQIDPTLCLHL